MGSMESEDQLFAVPFAPQDARFRAAPDSAPRHAEAEAAMRMRRGGELLGLDRVLLHNPAVALGWNAMFGAIRSSLSLAPHLVELATLVVAVSTRSAYVWQQHARLFATLSPSPRAREQLRALGHGAWQSERALFDPTEWAVACVAYESACHVRVPDAVFDDAVECLGCTGAAEVLMVSAGYACVARLVVGAQVPNEQALKK